LAVLNNAGLARSSTFPQALEAPSYSEWLAARVELAPFPSVQNIGSRAALFPDLELCLLFGTPSPPGLYRNHGFSGNFLTPVFDPKNLYQSIPE
jgi:hypothetical protein